MGGLPFEGDIRHLYSKLNLQLGPCAMSQSLVLTYFLLHVFAHWVPVLVTIMGKASASNNSTTPLSPLLLYTELFHTETFRIKIRQAEMSFSARPISAALCLPCCVTKGGASHKASSH